MKTITRVVATAGVLGFGLFMSTQTASAGVTGTLQLGGGGSTVTVGANSLVWNGSAVVAANSALDYDNGSVLNSGTATFLNLPSPGIGSMNYMTFSAAPDVHFSLLSVGPGEAVCSVANSQHCSAFAGSPIDLDINGNSTVVSLQVSGLAYDGTSVISTWSGTYSETVTQLPGLALGTPITPLEIQAYFGGPNNPNAQTLMSTYSGTFIATINPVPEPSSMAMMALGAGGVMIGMIRRRKQTR